jgi:hypothetical protein
MNRQKLVENHAAALRALSERNHGRWHTVTLAMAAHLDPKRFPREKLPETLDDMQVAAEPWIAKTRS